MTYENMGPKYPDIEVELSGTVGNAFSIMGKVRRAMKRNGVSDDEIQKYTDESTSGDYDNVLVTAMRWVTVL